MPSLASATPISGASGSTGQTGSDPANNWFVWTCPATGYYVFDTRASGTTYNTTLNGYLRNSVTTPEVIGDLSLLTYVSAGKAPGGYGFEFGALIAFSATIGSVYYFNVASRDGSTTGNIGLEWKPYTRTTLGACTAGIVPGTGLCYLASASEPASSSAGNWGAGTASFGTFAQGYYVVIYVAGATANGSAFNVGWDPSDSPFIIWNGYPANYVGVWSSPHSYATGDIIYSPQYGGSDTSGIYQCLNAITSGSIPQSDTTNWQLLAGGGTAMVTGLFEFGSAYPNSGFGTLTSYPTFWDAENAFACTSVAFTNPAGEITLNWMNSSVSSVSGKATPHFALYGFELRDQLALTISSVANNGFTNGVDASGGYNYTVSVNIQNSSFFAVPGAFGLVFNGGTGITVTSTAAQTVASLAAGASTGLNWTFSSSNNDLLVGSFQFQDWTATNVGSAITLTLASATWLIHLNYDFGCSTGVLHPNEDIFVVQNLGPVPISSVAISLTATSANFSAPGSSTPCAGPFATSPWTISTGVIPPNGAAGATLTYNIGTQRTSTSAPTSQTLTFVSSVGSITIPNYTHAITLQ